NATEPAAPTGTCATPLPPSVIPPPVTVAGACPVTEPPRVIDPAADAIGGASVRSSSVTLRASASPPVCHATRSSPAAVGAEASTTSTCHAGSGEPTGHALHCTRVPTARRRSLYDTPAVMLPIAPPPICVPTPATLRYTPYEPSLNTAAVMPL